MPTSATEHETNCPFVATESSAAGSSPRGSPEWRVRHLARTVRGGSRTPSAACDGCDAPLTPDTGWYRPTFYRGCWTDGEERTGRFCTEQCVQGWLNRENAVLRR